MRTKWILALTMAMGLATAAAAAKPDFSGEWKLNTTKSDFGQMPAPSSMTATIKHEDPKLAMKQKQSSDRGDFEWDVNYTTDGKESTNTVREMPMKSVLHWDGDTLMAETKGRFGDNDFTMSDKWTLSADGKVLTMNRHFTSAMGEGDQTLVLDKQ